MLSFNIPEGEDLKGGGKGFLKPGGGDIPPGSYASI